MAGTRPTINMALPAIDRHEKIADETSREQAKQKQNLVKKEETAATLGAYEFVHVGASDWHLPAGANSLKEPECHHGGSVPRKEARQIH